MELCRFHCVVANCVLKMYCILNEKSSYLKKVDLESKCFPLLHISWQLWLISSLGNVKRSSKCITVVCYMENLFMYGKSYIAFRVAEGCLELSAEV